MQSHADAAPAAVHVPAERPAASVPTGAACPASPSHEASDVQVVMELPHVVSAAREVGSELLVPTSVEASTMEPAVPLPGTLIPARSSISSQAATQPVVLGEDASTEDTHTVLAQASNTDGAEPASTLLSAQPMSRMTDCVPQAIHNVAAEHNPSTSSTTPTGFRDCGDDKAHLQQQQDELEQANDVGLDKNDGVAGPSAPSTPAPDEALPEARPVLLPGDKASDVATPLGAEPEAQLNVDFSSAPAVALQDPAVVANAKGPATPEAQTRAPAAARQGGMHEGPRPDVPLPCAGPTAEVAPGHAAGKYTRPSSTASVTRAGEQPSVASPPLGQATTGPRPGMARSAAHVRASAPAAPASALPATAVWGRPKPAGTRLPAGPTPTIAPAPADEAQLAQNQHPLEPARPVSSAEVQQMPVSPAADRAGSAVINQKAARGYGRGTQGRGMVQGIQGPGRHNSDSSGAMSSAQQQQPDGSLSRVTAGHEPEAGHLPGARRNAWAAAANGASGASQSRQARAGDTSGPPRPHAGAGPGSPVPAPSVWGRQSPANAKPSLLDADIVPAAVPEAPVRSRAHATIAPAEPPTASGSLQVSERRCRSVAGRPADCLKLG